MVHLFTNEDIQHENDCEEKVGNHEHMECPVARVKIVGDRIVSASLYVESLRWEGQALSVMRNKRGSNEHK